MRDFRKYTVVVLAFVFLYGCGQKGPLFMPEPAKTNSLPDTTKQPEPSADNKN
ncbi:lipoprotein [Alteromonadaceae bacterium BrNp21-10]|nr:lipoprotein [Alteromonadaceae bacterium BrNp21-10]